MATSATHTSAVPLTPAKRTQSPRRRRRPSPFTMDYRMGARYTCEPVPLSSNPQMCTRVFRAVDNRTGEQVAVKEISYSATDAHSLDIAKVEVGVLIKLNRLASNPSVMAHRQVFWDRDACRFHVVMPWCAGGSLYDAIVAAGRLPERVAQRFFAQLVRALHDIHAHGVVHRDVKPANCLLLRGQRSGEGSHADTSSAQVVCGADTPFTAVLADFGLARVDGVADVFHNAVVGTLEYLAPEMLGPEGPRPSPSSDVWALGVTLFNMLTGRPAFDSTKGDVATAIRRGDFVLRRRWFQGVSSQAKAVVRACMTVNPAARATTEELLRHSWVEAGLQTEAPPVPVPVPRRLSYPGAGAGHPAPAHVAPVEESKACGSGGGAGPAACASAAPPARTTQVVVAIGKLAYGAVSGSKHQQLEAAVRWRPASLGDPDSDVVMAAAAA